MKIKAITDLKRKIVKLIYIVHVVQGFKSASRIHEITVLIRASNIWEYASPGLVRWSKIV